MCFNAPHKVLMHFNTILRVEQISNLFKRNNTDELLLFFLSEVKERISSL